MLASTEMMAFGPAVDPRSQVILPYLIKSCKPSNCNGASRFLTIESLVKMIKSASAEFGIPKRSQIGLRGTRYGRLQQLYIQFVSGTGKEAL